MPSTPPAQIRSEIRTPPTPLHGSAYRSQPTPSRYNTRSAARQTPDSTLTSSFASNSPRSTRQQSDLHLHLPASAHGSVTPRRKTSRPVQRMISASPEPEDSDHQQPKPSHLSAATIFTEGMLPTPAKTPQKNKLPKSTMAARVLFQDLPDIDSPRKVQKKKMRHNGFSLESFAEASTANNDISIHVDSRDHVPELDKSTNNPFYDGPATSSSSPIQPSSPKSSKKRAAPSSATTAPSTTVKRRKVSTEKSQLDPQVQAAIEKDEGMVYVFRGKKVYRRFDDTGDEEEVIDPEELGLLGRQSVNTQTIGPLKTLTRKSIKPRRLFVQSTGSKSTSSPINEDVETVLETDLEADAKGEGDDDDQPELTSPTRQSRSRAAKIDSIPISTQVLPTLPASEDASSTMITGKRTRNSPFDRWPRMKSGSRSAPVGTPAGSAKGRKRTVAEALET